MNPDIHIPVFCAVEGCHEEATRWIPLDRTLLRLCVDHLIELDSPNDDEPEYFNGREIGVYSCSEDCGTCNS